MAPDLTPEELQLFPSALGTRYMAVRLRGNPGCLLDLWTPRLSPPSFGGAQLCQAPWEPASVPLPAANSPFSDFSISFLGTDSVYFMPE